MTVQQKDYDRYDHIHFERRVKLQLKLDAYWGEKKKKKRKSLRLNHWSMQPAQQQTLHCKYGNEPFESKEMV